MHSIPPDVVYMIMELLKHDLDTIRACCLSVRTFRTVAQSFLGRHISVNGPERVKECLGILKKSGFQHIRSLSLGITGKRMILEEFWRDYLAILKIFAGRRSLVQLWLWEVPFFFLQLRQKKMFKEIVIALSSSVNNLGLYGCHFSCYEEMVSFVRAFHCCNQLSIEDCVTGGQAAPVNLLVGLPQHKLSITDLNITTSLKNELLIRPSKLIEDAELDISSLSKLVCDVQSAEGILRILSAASRSPIRELWFSASCPEGFQGTYTTRSPVLVIVITLMPHRYHSIRNFGVASMALGVIEDWTDVPRSRFCVLGSCTQGLPETPSPIRDRNHLRLSYTQVVQYLLLGSFQFYPFRPPYPPVPGVCVYLPGGQVTEAED